MLLAGGLAAASWLVFSFTEGWTAIVLWVVVALPAGLLGEFLLREKQKVRRSPRSRPRMSVRAPLSRDRTSSRTKAKEDEDAFPWHRESPPPPQNRRGAPRR